MTRAVKVALLCTAAAAFPVRGLGQEFDPLSVTAKFHFHAENVVSPIAIAGSAAYAGILQADSAPTEWGQGSGAYAKRFGSTMAWSGIHGALAFGLDTTLKQDPRYHRSGADGFWRRSGHALRGTIFTRTDNGGETLSTWRIGSAYGAAYLSNQWYPARLNTARLGLIQGSATLGLDLVSNLGAEFWPDVKSKLFRRK